jgi:hypothetical protein
VEPGHSRSLASLDLRECPGSTTLIPIRSKYVFRRSLHCVAITKNVSANRKVSVVEPGHSRSLASLELRECPGSTTLTFHSHLRFCRSLHCVASDEKLSANRKLSSWNLDILEVLRRLTSRMSRFHDDNFRFALTFLSLATV